MKEIEILGRKIGHSQPCFIIAEAGVNHNGDVDLAHQLVDAAVDAGADAVKFQTFNADLLVTKDAAKASYQLKSSSPHESQYEMLSRLELSEGVHQDLMSYCKRKGILFMSTPFDDGSVDMLADLGMSVFKIPSGELTNLPFLAYVAGKGRPLIISTGMACLGEVESAVAAVEKTGNTDIVLLHCVSSYPAASEDVNLRAMETLKTAFNVPTGYSDHTPGIEIAMAAVALGACVIEKHFTLDRSLPGPDHQASLEPEELKALVHGIRKVEKALGDGRKHPAPSEADTAAAARRSLVAAVDIPAGTRLTEEHIAVKRPGTGLPPALRPFLVGLTVNMSIPTGKLLSLEMFS